MTAEEYKLRKERFARIRLIKKLLRPLPRRATLHRYPVLNRFAASARKRSYLWSFRITDVVPAIYIGAILAFMPTYGFQILVAFAMALLFRKNLMVLVGLQMITNPITAGPIYIFTYQLGQFFMDIVNSGGIPTEAIEGFGEETGIPMIRKFMYNVSSLILGGLICGYFVAFTLSITYQFMAQRTAIGYQTLVKKKNAKNPPSADQKD